MAHTDKSCEATDRYTNLLVGHSTKTELLFGERTQVLGLGWRWLRKWKKAYVLTCNLVEKARFTGMKEKLMYEDHEQKYSQTAIYRFDLLHFLHH